VASDQSTLSKQIISRVLRDLALPAEDVRVSFETINPLLDHPVAAGRKWLCRPLTRLPLGTVQFESQLVEGAKVLERLNVQTKVERRQRVVVTTARLDRGDIVTVGHLAMEDAWLDRNLPTLLLSDKGLVGLEAQRAIEVGSMADQRDFKPAMMATKNDTVTVIYVAGTLQVQMRGRAMADGKLHDQVPVRNEATGERYQAVMIAKGLAVVGGTLTEAEEKKLIGGR
jgi:flagella basal body P-ring formation protein FlgA